MKILIQAGHEGRTTGSTGAPNEQSFNVDISNKVADELRKRGFEVKRVNADPTPEEISGDWDLFLSIHYDADVYGTGGGFVDYPEPSTDGATEESQRIAYLIRQEYFGTTGIINKSERSNKNTRYYYMWSKLSAKTPCVIIECGVGMHVPDDWEVLHFQRPKVVEGIVKGICLAFNVNYEINQDPIIPDYNCDKEKAEIEALKAGQNEAIKQAVGMAILENNTNWQSKLDSANETIGQLEKELSEAKKTSINNYSWQEILSIGFKKMWASKRR